MRNSGTFLSRELAFIRDRYEKLYLAGNLVYLQLVRDVYDHLKTSVIPDIV